MNELLTVVIPCKNEGYGIIKAIKELENKYPVIIADSSDDTITKELLNQYAADNTNIKIVEGGLPSVARNNGAKYVKTPYVLFLDADIYLKDKTIIPECLKQIHTKALVTIKLTTFETEYRWVFAIFNLIQKFTALTKPFAVGGFMLFRTETFAKLGGFNEADKIAEDYRLSIKVHPKRFKIVNKTAYTTARRFQKKGVGYMLRLLILCWLNRNNEKFFTNDQNYWI